MSIVKELLEKAQELKEEAHQFQNELSGVLRVSAIPGLMKILLKVFSKFKKNHPNVQLNISEKDSKDIIEEVLNNKLDIGLINLYDNFLIELNNLPFELLYNSQVYFCVNKNSHLALKENVSPDDLQNETIVLYNDEYIKSFANSLLKNVPYNLLFISDNVEAIRVAVSEEIAATFATDSTIKDEITRLNGQNVAIPIVSSISSLVPFGFIRSNNKQVSLMNDKFINYLKKEFISLEKTHI